MNDITIFTPEENLSSRDDFLAYLAAQDLSRPSDRTCYVARVLGHGDTFCVRGTQITLYLTDKTKLSQSLPEVFKGIDKGYAFYVISSVKDGLKASPFWSELYRLLTEVDNLKMQAVLLSLVIWLAERQTKPK